MRCARWLALSCRLVGVADNVGGGCPGDGTALLAELLARRATGAVVALADPEVAGHTLVNDGISSLGLRLPDTRALSHMEVAPDRLIQNRRW